MSSIFNLKRAGKYFLHDLDQIRNNGLMNILVIGLMPVIFFVFYNIFSVLKGLGLSRMDDGMQVFAIMLSVLMLVVIFPIKHYGLLTDKRYGSDWLMLPASTFEKWLSVILVNCVVVPAVFAVLFLGSDALFAAIFPKVYPSAILSRDFFDFLDGLRNGLTDDIGVKFNVAGILYINWCENILVFTLGAIIFKKAKFPKTLLCVMGISMLLSVILVAVCGSTHIDVEQIQSWFSDKTPEELGRAFNNMMTVIYAVLLLLLCGGLYLRLKTLKH